MPQFSLLGRPSRMVARKSALLLSSAAIAIFGALPAYSGVPAVAAADGIIPTSPAVATSPDGTLTLLATYSTGQLGYRVRSGAKGDWGSWKSAFDKGTGGPPAVAQNLNKGQVVFVRGTNGTLRYQKISGKGEIRADVWNVIGQPAGVSLEGNPVVVANNNVYSKPSDSSTKVSNTDGRLEVFVRGSDNGLWYTVQKAPNGDSWTDWKRLGGNWEGNPAAIVEGDGRIGIFARTADGHIKHSAQRAQGTQQDPQPDWTPWLDLGDGFTGGVAVAGNITKSGRLLQIFGNRAGNLYTMTQSAPGTANDPDGTWAAGMALGPAFTTNPVTASYPDGRLAVFGVNAQGKVAYRAQTQSADDKNFNGIWVANRVVLDGLREAATSLAVETSTSGAVPGFDVFAMANGSVFQRTQLAAGTPDGSRADAWLGWKDLAWPFSGPCEPPGGLPCLQIYNPNLHLPLAVNNSGTPNGQEKAPIGQDRWALVQQRDANGKETGSFDIVTRYYHTCLYLEYSDSGTDPTPSLKDCGSMTPEDRWSLEPVGSNSVSEPDSYRLHSWAWCLAFDSDRNLGVRYCPGTTPTSQDTWKLGENLPTFAEETAEGVVGLVAKYAAYHCKVDAPKAKCTFVDGPTTPAYQASSGCIEGTVIFNDSTEKAQFSRAVTKSTGSTWTVGTNIEFGPLKDLFKISFDANHAWTETATTGGQTTVTVPPQQFGWIERAPVLRETSGSWRYSNDDDGLNWNFSGRNISYAKNGTNGAVDFTVTKTSNVPPTSGHCE
ncbi:hypothetical protein [Streptomyces sp. NBC_00096]|uniref:hypothetical protein n=1 Tax=Streptomyces sp. NBC_00096 TaxID=2975650 RepID=UPI003254C4A4